MSPLPLKPIAAAPSRLFLAAPLGFISLALLWCQVGYLTPTVSRALGGILWLLTVYLSADKKRLLWVVLSAALLFNPYGAVHRPEGLWLLGLLPWAGGFWGKRWMGAAWMAALGGWIWSNFPGLWVPLDDFIASAAHWFSKANLSSAAAGLPLLALAVCFPLAAMFSERRLFSSLTVIVGLMGSLLLYWWLQRPLEVYLHRHGVYGIHDAFSMQWALLVLMGLVLAIWGYFYPPRLTAFRKRGALFIPALSLAGALLVGWPSSIGAPQLEREVIFYNKGYLNWRVPVYGAYGRHAAGMFGLIPDYLRGRGFNVSLEDSLTREVLDKARAVVIVNLMDLLSAPEETALHQFVEAGGSLLLLGDHTGLANIREPSNRLLEPYGIELNFDSAKPTRTGWAGSLITGRHPLTARLGLVRQGGASPGVAQIWVGASLKVSPPGKPLIVGREGWSDIGDEANEKDGYLGDFRYRTNERLGNLVLLAEARAGDGKVLVFGDTSTLQNGALVRAGDFAYRIFAYLISPVEQPHDALPAIGVLLLAGAVAVWAFSGAGQVGLALLALALFLGAHFCQQRTAAVWNGADRIWVEEASPRALIDHSHAPRTPLNQTSGDGHWGLQNCLMRSGFLPQTMESWDEKTLFDASVLLEMAPAKRFRREELRAIAQFMSNGGLVILCCGAEEFDGSKSLLKEYGLEPIYVPLGPAELDSVRIFLPTEGDTVGADVEKYITVRFHEAWETRVSNPIAEVLLEGYDRPVVVYVPVGEGGLLFIPDTDFLSNCNLESPTDDYYEDNILYLRYLLRVLAGGEADYLSGSKR